MNSPEATHAEPPPPNSQTQASGAPKGKEKNHTSAIPLRITEGLKALVSAGAARLELSEQETIRIATRVGLERLARIDWNLAAALEDAAGGAPETRMRECFTRLYNELGVGLGNRKAAPPPVKPVVAIPKTPPQPTPEQHAAKIAQAQRDRNLLCAGRPQ